MLDNNSRTSLLTTLLLADAVRKADDGDHWVTINGNHVLFGPGGEIKGGHPLGGGAARHAEAGKFKQSREFGHTVTYKAPSGAKVSVTHSGDRMKVSLGGHSIFSGSLKSVLSFLRRVFGINHKI